MRDKLEKVLDDYYGEGCDDRKDEIINFLESNGDAVLPILKEEFGEE